MEEQVDFRALLCSRTNNTKSKPNAILKVLFNKFAEIVGSKDS